MGRVVSVPCQCPWFQAPRMAPKKGTDAREKFLIPCHRADCVKVFEQVEHVEELRQSALVDPGRALSSPSNPPSALLDKKDKGYANNFLNKVRDHDGLAHKHRELTWPIVQAQAGTQTREEKEAKRAKRVSCCCSGVCMAAVV